MGLTGMTNTVLVTPSSSQMVEEDVLLPTRVLNSEQLHSVIAEEFCTTSLTNLFVSSTNSSIVSSPKNNAKNSLCLASTDKGIRKPGWAVNGNAVGPTSVSVSTAVHSGDSVR